MKTNRLSQYNPTIVRFILPAMALFFGQLALLSGCGGPELTVPTVATTPVQTQTTPPEAAEPVKTTTPQVPSEPEASVTAKFCFKNSYPRIETTQPVACGADDDIAGLCYPKCKPGYVGRWFYCQQETCPPDFRNDPAHCAKPITYGRGGGYPWKFGDKAFDYEPARQRCERENSQGCEKDGLIWYPKCKPNYRAVGCCLCEWSAGCPDDMTDIGVSCVKKHYYRATTGSKYREKGCPADSEYDLGLCYKVCDEGFTGDGPLCRGSCPSGMVDCGAMCGQSQGDCNSEAVKNEEAKNRLLLVVDLAKKITKVMKEANTVGGAPTATDEEKEAKKKAQTEATTVAKNRAKDFVEKLKRDFAGQEVDVKKLFIESDQQSDAVKSLLAGIKGAFSSGTDALAKLGSMFENPAIFDYASFFDGADKDKLKKLEDETIQSFRTGICHR